VLLPDPGGELAIGGAPIAKSSAEPNSRLYQSQQRLACRIKNSESKLEIRVLSVSIGILNRF
jgi:hypothetical protein